jgi:hypothetical protein
MATLRLVPASGEPFEVKGDSALVGREPSCDLVVADGSVSRKHARLERRDGGWTVVDQGSANGTFLDSQRVAEAALRPGQDLRFGAVTYRVEIEYEDTGTVSVSFPSADATVVASPQDMTTPALGIVLPSVIPTKPSTPAAAPPPPLPKAAAPAFPRPPAPAAPAPAPPPRQVAPPSSVPPVAPAPSRPAPPRAQAAAAPVGQMPAPPLEKKGRSPVFWIVTGCCGCLLLGVLLAMGIGGAAFYATQAPAAAVQEQLTELRRGDFEAAYRHLSRDLQAQLPPEDFERLVREHPGLAANKDATFWNRSVNNDRARLTGLLTPSSGDTETATFELVKEGGEWKITAIRVGGSATP